MISLSDAKANITNAFFGYNKKCTDMSKLNAQSDFPLKISDAVRISVCELDVPFEFSWLFPCLSDHMSGTPGKSLLPQKIFLEKI